VGYADVWLDSHNQSIRDLWHQRRSSFLPSLAAYLGRRRREIHKRETMAINRLSVITEGISATPLLTYALQNLNEHYFSTSSHVSMLDVNVFWAQQLIRSLSLNCPLLVNVQLSSLSATGVVGIWHVWLVQALLFGGAVALLGEFWEEVELRHPGLET
jgi:hypothetical protein